MVKFNNYIQFHSYVDNLGMNGAVVIIYTFSDLLFWKRSC